MHTVIDRGAVAGATRLPEIIAVAENDLCIACGACVHACPYDAVAPAYNAQRGAWEIEVTDTSPCVTCVERPCEPVCPSIEVDYPALTQAAFEDAGLVETFHEGPVEAVYLAYAPAHRDNGVSSSGGVVRLLIDDALTRGVPVICLAKTEEGYAPAVVRDAAELPRVPGSIYHGVSFHGCIGLLKALETPCYLAATPCQIEGLMKYAHAHAPELLDKIELTIGLICGWMYSDHSLAAFRAFKGIDQPIVDAAYRGEDKVGLLKLKTPSAEYRYDRRVFPTVRDRIDYQASFSSAANRLRCRLCENHLNVLADVAVGDAWLSREPTAKLSIILARSKRGNDVLRKMQLREELVLQPATKADIIESQSDDLVYGHTAKKLRQFLQGRDVYLPVFSFPTSEAGSAHLGWRDRLQFRVEWILRGLIRARRYRTFRRLYFGYHLRRYVPWVSQLLTAMRRGVRAMLGRGGRS
jgi:coenzyme F420 hydrogenase subunit beta